MASVTRCAAILAVAVLGCSTPITVENLPAAVGRSVRKIALMPLRVAHAEVAPERPDAAEVVTARVLEALAARPELAVIPPEEVARVIEPKTEPVLAAPILHEKFGVDGSLSGVVRRFVTRIGSDAGVTRPASVRFDLELRDATGEVLWRGRYDETQQSLAENLGEFPRARERRFRWVDADQLAAYGARELVSNLP